MHQFSETWCVPNADVWEPDGVRTAVRGLLIQQGLRTVIDGWAAIGVAWLHRGTAEPTGGCPNATSQWQPVREPHDHIAIRALVETA